MSNLQALMTLDSGEARRKFARATTRFNRMVEVRVENLPFPARWHGGRLLVVKPDLTKYKDVMAAHMLHRELIRLDRELQFMARAYLAEKGVLALLEEMLRLRKVSAFKADFVDLAILHDLAEASEPQQMLELGSGLSTVVLGHAAREGGGQLICLEPSAEWALHTSNTLPVSIRPHVSVVHTPVDEVSLEGRQTRAFRLGDEPLPDFIYVDGAPSGAWFQGLETVMQLESQMIPGTVIAIDCRDDAIRAILGLANHGAPDEQERRLKRNYDIHAQGLWMRIRDTRVPVGPCFGLDNFCNLAALLTD